MQYAASCEGYVKEQNGPFLTKAIEVWIESKQFERVWIAFKL
jgi:hypothetical protein